MKVRAKHLHWTREQGSNSKIDTEEEEKITFSRAPAGPELESSREETEEVLSSKKEQRKVTGMIR